MKNLSIASGLLGLCFSSAAALAAPAGYTVMNFDVPHHDAEIEGAVWYPTSSATPARTVNENAVFYGVKVISDAEPMGGKHPVVLLSHGMGGNYRSMTWLGAGLAERGAIVIAVNHPASSTWDFDIRAGLDHWTRAQDLSAAFDQLQADPRIAPVLDMSRVMAAGFSYGGWTALSLGGVTGKLEASAQHCEEYGPLSSHCDDIKRAGVDFSTLNSGKWNASYKDARVSMVAAIDPALHYGLDESHAENLVGNVQMFALGEGKDRLLATDYGETGSGFGAKLPDAILRTIAPASHFMALPLCKPRGELILKEENDDPVCTDPEGADRAAVHTTIIDSIATQLGL